MGFLHDLLSWQTIREVSSGRGHADLPALDGGVCISYKNGTSCLIVTNEYVYVNLGNSCLDENGLSRHLPPTHLPGGGYQVYGAGLFSRGADTYYLKARSEMGSGRVRLPPSAEEVGDVSRLIDAFVALGRTPERFHQVFDAMKTMERKRWSERSMDDWHTDPTWPNEALRAKERCATMLNIAGEVPTIEHEQPGAYRNYSTGTVDTQEPAAEEDLHARELELELYESWLYGGRRLHASDLS